MNDPLTLIYSLLELIYKWCSIALRVKTESFSKVTYYPNSSININIGGGIESYPLIKFVYKLEICESGITYSGRFYKIRVYFVLFYYYY